MGERSHNIGKHWRLGLAVPLLVSGVFYGAHATDQSLKDNNSTANKYRLDGAVLFGAGVFFIWRDIEAEKKRITSRTSLDDEPIESCIPEASRLIELDLDEPTTLDPKVD